MKIFFSHSSAVDYQTVFYQPIKRSVLFQQHDIILPHDAADFKDSKPLIQSADLVLAEVSYPSTGQGIELGWANCFDKRVICLHEAVAKPSSALQVITGECLEYQGSEGLITLLDTTVYSISRSIK